MADYKRYNTRSSKLTIAEVQALRCLYHEEGWSQGRLARKFNLSVVQVGRIVRGESQRAVPEIADTSAADVDPNAPAPDPAVLEESMARLAEKLTNTSLESTEDPLEAVLRQRGGANPLARRPINPSVDGAVPQVDIEETRDEQDKRHD